MSRVNNSLTFTGSFVVEGDAPGSSGNQGGGDRVKEEPGSRSRRADANTWEGSDAKHENDETSRIFRASSARARPGGRGAQGLARCRHAVAWRDAPVAGRRPAGRHGLRRGGRAGE